jgi:hypothetical protein
MKVARRVLSTSLNPRKHRLAQKKAGLVRNVLLHGSIVTKGNVFFQCYLFMSVITRRYEWIVPLSYPRGTEGIVSFWPT